MEIAMKQFLLASLTMLFIGNGCVNEQTSDEPRSMPEEAYASPVAPPSREPATSSASSALEGIRRVPCNPDEECLSEAACAPFFSDTSRICSLPAGGPAWYCCEQIVP
jgi:hypothetical protein